jgi:hypothetical protein
MSITPLYLSNKIPNYTDYAGLPKKFQGDKAYVGEPAIDTPHKKTRSRGITEQQKQENQKKARKRVVVEHLIRLVKTLRSAAERFR